MTERVKYARRASGRVTSYAVDSEDDSTDADEAVHTTKRRSTANKGRGKGKRMRANTDDDDSTAGEASDESDSPKKKTKPRKKRAKKSHDDDNKKKKKQRGNRGKLETIQMLPLEMLGEIFSHVGPKTLLSLRLVNKQFHAFLSAKSSEPIWKAARVRADLPEVKDLTEMQYAELVFGNTCQGCYGDKVGKIYHDFYLRKNFCKRCRRLKMVNVTKLSREAPEAAARLHPLAVKCVLRSAHSGKRAWQKRQGWYRTKFDFANLDDLWYYDRILRDLDAQDEASDIAAEREPADSPQHEDLRPTRSSNRARRSSASKRHSYKEESESDDEEDAMPHISRRGKEFADARQGVLNRTREARSDLHRTFIRASTLQKREREKITASKGSAPEPLERLQRDTQIQRRLLEEDPDLDRRIFTSRRWYSAVQRFASGVKIDDEGWSQIKTQAHAACAKMAPKLIVDQLARDQATASTKLRPRYNQLLESLNEAACLFVPLYIDFLLLPSVKALWAPGVLADDAKWAAQLPLIKEELDEYRLELVLHARQEILAATTDPSTASQDNANIVEDDESLNDAFFQLATSFVCCAFASCPRKEGPPRQRWYWRTSARATVEDPREGWIGPLVDVLKHQHRFHNSDSRLPTKAAKASYPPFRVSLPLEVACGIEALLELHQLDNSKAKKRHLDEASKKSSGYEWFNSGLTRRYFSGKDAWWNMLGWIKREGAKAARCQLFLEPPEIRFRRARDDKLVINVDDDDEAGAKAKKASSSGSGAAGRISSDEEEEDEDSEEGEDSQDDEDESDEDEDDEDGMDEQSSSDEDEDGY